MADLNYNDVVSISAEDAKQQTLSDLDTAGLDTTSWQEGSTQLLQVELESERQSKMADIAVYLKSAFIPSTPNCTGDALSTASSGFYNNTRAKAVEAQHLVTLTCAATSGPYTINTGDLVVSNVSPDKQVQSTFRNVAGNSVVYPYVLASGGSQTFLFESETAGSQANIASDPTNTGVSTTFTLVTTLAGVTITSHSLYRSGVDQESDARLLERDQLKWAGELGTLELFDDRVKAVAFNAVPAITTVGVDSTNPRGQGTFDVYVAELDSTASPTDVAQVQLAIDLRTMGRNNTPKTCIVYGAPETPIDIAGVIYFLGSDAVTIGAAIAAALLEFIRAAPCGGYSFLPGAQHVIAKEDIAAIMRDATLAAGATKATVVLSNPTVNVSVPQFGKVIRGNWDGITPILTNA